MGIMEQTVGSHLLCEVNVLVFKTVPHHSPHLLSLVSLRVSTVTDMIIDSDVVYPILVVWYILTNFQCKSSI